MTPHHSFGRRADTYDSYNVIQERVARELAASIEGTYEKIVDLGCGTGGFFRAYDRSFTSYLAIDISPRMLARHPQKEGVEKLVGDFNDPALFEKIAAFGPDLVVSSSALQWAEDLDGTLGQISALKKPTALALFTSGTFQTLHETAGVRSPIRDAEETERLLRKYFHAPVRHLRERLHFDNTLAMLRYIQRSGVSGPRPLLDYRQVKKVLRAYPLDYLEFEVLLLCRC